MLIQRTRIPIKEFVLFGLLPCSIKKFVYKLKGYRIGRKVKISLGSIICGKDVVIGDYCKIGFFTIIRAQEIKIGSHVNIGSMTFLDTPFLEIGDDSKINEQVFVGGLQWHDSRFVLGKNCQVMQMSFINPAKSIVVGDDSGIGGHCLLFGHASWQSQFEGYPVEFAPIEIGNSVSLTWRVFIMPGIKIGDGSVIGPNSLVTKDIPPKSLAAGYPARVLSMPPNFPKDVSEEQKVEILRNIVDEMIDYFNGSGLKCDKKGAYYEITQANDSCFFRKVKRFSMSVEYESISEYEFFPEGYDASVLVSLRAIPKEIRTELNSRGVMWLDIEKKERPMFWNDLGDEVALFLRRYGVRFFRVKE